MKAREISKKNKSGKKWWKMLIACFVVVISLVSMLVYKSTNWVLDTWGLISIDEILYHLREPIQGTNQEVIIDALKTCLPLPIIMCIGLSVLLFYMYKRKRLYYIILGMVFCASIAVAGFSVKNVWGKLEISDYIESRDTKSMYIEDNYVEPKSENLTFPEKKRNLIYIFLESMENTYMSIEDGGAFEKGCIPELTALAKDNVSFSNTDKLGGAIPTRGNTWTIGGMFGESTGMPMLLPVSENSMDTQEEFYPKIVSLGDLLEENGYNQTLLIGSSATFGGRDKYYVQHGNYNILDYDAALKEKNIPEGYKVFWGYEDQKLFEFAKDELIKLSKEEEPFNLTMLTVDTHFEDGYVCDLCDSEFGDDQYANVMACSSKQIAEFIAWIQAQEFYENTTIVLCGDHLTMDKNFCEGIDDGYTRTVYNAFINSAIEPVRTKNRVFTTLDMFPSTLASLGVEIKGERLGLGTNLFADKETLAEVESVQYINEEFKKGSTFYDQFVNNIFIHWKEIDGKWYYYENENEVRTGWQYIDMVWYYLHEDGSMAVEEWVDGYYLGKSGAWDKTKQVEE